MKQNLVLTTRCSTLSLCSIQISTLFHNILVLKKLLELNYKVQEQKYVGDIFYLLHKIHHFLKIGGKLCIVSISLHVNSEINAIIVINYKDSEQFDSIFIQRIPSNNDCLFHRSMIINVAIIICYSFTF